MNNISHIKIKDILEKIFYFAMILLLIGLIALKIFTVFLCDTPKECREMNTVAFAYNFAHGINPYSESIIDRAIPAVTNVYGFLVPLLMSPFIRIFSFTSMNVLQICEMVTIFVEIAGIYFFYKLIYDRTANHLLCAFGCISFFGCFWRYTAFAGAFPDQWGVVLSILLMKVVIGDEKKNNFRPLLYSAIVVLVFYIKQYFVFCVLGLLVYTMIRSKKNLLKLCMYGGILGIISLVLVHNIFPLYLVEVLPMAQGTTISNNLSYSLKQIAEISGSWYLLISIPALAGVAIKIFSAFKERNIENFLSYELCQILFTIFPLVHIARNNGTIYTYYLQLWYPYVIFFGISCLNSAIEFLKSNWENKYIEFASSLLLLLLMLTSIYNERILIYSGLPSETQASVWKEAYEILDVYSARGEILVPGHLSGYCLENGIETSEYGQAEFNNAFNLEMCNNSKIWPIIFEQPDILLRKNIEYNRLIRDKIQSQEYSCVAVTVVGSYGLVSSDLEDSGYYLLDTKVLTTGYQALETKFYILEK